MKLETDINGIHDFSELKKRKVLQTFEFLLFLLWSRGSSVSIVSD
jgi:hypothetical protein